MRQVEHALDEQAGAYQERKTKRGLTDYKRVVQAVSMQASRHRQTAIAQSVRRI